MIAVAAGLVKYQFNPAVETSMPRLAQQEKMYERYRIRFMNITYKPATSAMTAGSMKFGILPGISNASVTADTILKLTPHRIVPVWKSASIVVNQFIDQSRFMVCGDTTADGIAFYLYASSTEEKPTGYFQIAYEVEFAYPKPF